MKTENIKNLIKNEYLKNLHAPDGPEMDNKILTDAWAAMEKSQKTTSAPPQPNIWRIIMKNKLSKPALAAIIIVAVLFFSWINRQQVSPDGKESITCFSLLTKACVAEEILFTSEKIVHIVNEIIVYPAVEDSAISDRLDKLELHPDQRKYFETVNSWLDYNWLPICSLQKDGQFRFNQLNVATDLDQPYTITDQAWYDPAGGRFVRLMKTEETPVFANSYDGEFIYFSQTASDGSFQLANEPVIEDFRPPRNPAEFLGLSAGFRSTIQQQDFQPIQDITEGTLADGAPVHIYKQGFADLLGHVNTYWLLKVRDDDNTVAEMEFVIAGQKQMTIRRIRTETVEAPAVSWNLSEIEADVSATEPTSQVAIAPDMYILNVSVEHMVEKADFETYIFAVTPSWTNPPEIADMVDFADPKLRMFCMVYTAKDDRHLILSQSQSFNSFFTNILNIRQNGRLISSHSNDVKVWAGGPDKWWTEIHLRNCGFTPAQDRSGYVLETPDGTFLSLAVNGQLTNEELQTLAQSLVPAKDYIQK